MKIGGDLRVFPSPEIVAQVDRLGDARARPRRRTLRCPVIIKDI